MQPIMIARIAHVLAFTDVLQTAGAPLARELSKVGLPTLLEDKPDAYIPVIPALEFVQRMERKEGIDDIGFLASQQISFDQLSSDFIDSCQSEPTLYARLRIFSRLAPLENSGARVTIHREIEGYRICVHLFGYPQLEGLVYSEWANISALLGIVRKSVGFQWKPTEITFQSQFFPCQDAYEKFPNTRFYFGQKYTSIMVPASLLSRSLSSGQNDQMSDEEPITTPLSCFGPAKDYPASLKLLLRSYIQQTSPDVNLAAEMASTSVRTLQRRLGQYGLNFSRLVQQAKFEAAVDLLKDPAIKILDIAHAVGYSDPSHFARLFRRISGVSPGEYRRQHFMG